MSKIGPSSRELLDTLKTERDELRVKLHLASMDLDDRLHADWQSLEKRWAQLKADAHRIAGKSETLDEELEEFSDDFGTAGRELAHEILAGYARLRRALNARRKHD